jgi:cyclophilin family peptidyl-prolyl cis-trans isomerase
MRYALVLVAAAALLAAGCGGGDDDDESSDAASTGAQGTPECHEAEAPEAAPDGGEQAPSAPLAAGKTYELVFETSCGTFTVTLDPETAPNASASLVALARNGFFDNTIFHRIVPGFVIQGGDPTQSGSGGPGYTTVDKPPPNSKYTKGVVAMAKAPAEPAGAAGSQFFVVTAPDAGLPADYAIVGTVTEGLPVVELIGTLGDAAEQPTQTVLIEKVTVEES